MMRAIGLGFGLWFLALIVGTYLGFGFRHPWFFKIIHVCAGFALAMLFNTFALSWIWVCTGVLLVSTLYEGLEFFLQTPSVKAYLHRRIPWFVSQTSAADASLDYARNFAGVGIFYLLLYLLR